MWDQRDRYSIDSMVKQDFSFLYLVVNYCSRYFYGYVF